MNKHLVGALTAVPLLFALGGFSMPVQAEHTWGNYHWARDANPVTIPFGDNVSSDWDLYFVIAIDDWDEDKSVVIDTVRTTGQAKGRCRAADGRAEVCNDFYGANGWLGVAQIWVGEGHIVKGVVKVNDTYFSLPEYNTADWRQSVMCQEAGHIIGLGHNDEDFSTTSGTCMDYSNEPWMNLHPDQHDYDMLAQIYNSHFDATTSGGDGGGDKPCRGGPKKCGGNLPPPAMGEIDWNDHRNWGQLVAVSKNRRHAVFVRDFGGGHKVITHVTLA